MITPTTFKSKLSPSDNVRISALAVRFQGEYGAVSELAPPSLIMYPVHRINRGSHKRQSRGHR